MYVFNFPHNLFTKFVTERICSVLKFLNDFLEINVLTYIL